MNTARAPTVAPATTITVPQIWPNKKPTTKVIKEAIGNENATTKA